MAAIKPLLAKILIQVGADEPKEIGTIEIPLEISVSKKDEWNYHTTINVSDQDPEKIAQAFAERMSPFAGRIDPRTA